MNNNNLTREDCGKIQWPNYHFSHRWELWPSLCHFLFQTKIIFILLLAFEPVPKLPQVETWTKIIASHIILFLFLLFEPVLVCLNLDHFLFQTKIIYIYFYFYLNLWPNYHRWKRALHHIYSIFIPHICHFLYTGRIVKFKILHLKIPKIYPPKESNM